MTGGPTIRQPASAAWGRRARACSGGWNARRAAVLQWLVIAACLAVWVSPAAWAQSTSIRKRHATSQPAPESGREKTRYDGHKTLERNSLIAVPALPPKTFKVHDLITIVVRQQRKYESDAEQESKSKFEISSELDAFLKFIDGGVGSAAFRRGHPNIDYKFDSKLKNEADKEREDKLTTRITAEIIDVKPNGNLVLQARNEIKFDNDTAIMTLTGTCRQVDVSPDNTVLSTQLADLKIDNINTGAVRDGSRRGWLTQVLDFLKPI